MPHYLIKMFPLLFKKEGNKSHLIKSIETLMGEPETYRKSVSTNAAKIQFLRNRMESNSALIREYVSKIEDLKELVRKDYHLIGDIISCEETFGEKPKEKE